MNPNPCPTIPSWVSSPVQSPCLATTGGGIPWDVIALGAVLVVIGVFVFVVWPRIRDARARRAYARDAANTGPRARHAALIAYWRKKGVGDIDARLLADIGRDHPDWSDQRVQDRLAAERMGIR